MQYYLLEDLEMPGLFFLKKAIVESSTVGLQWVGWQWMVIAGETASPNLKNIAVAAAITANELIGCQAYGRLLDCIKEPINANQDNADIENSQLKETIILQSDPELIQNPTYSQNQKYLKAGLSSILAGNIFYIVDDAVSAACLGAQLSVPATLALRSISVGIADTIAFQIGSETSDMIKSKKCCGLQLFKDNIASAIEAGVLAVSYTLGNYIGEVVSDACGVQDSDDRNAISSLFIFCSTAVTVGLKHLIGNTCCKKGTTL